MRGICSGFQVARKKESQLLMEPCRGYQKKGRRRVALLGGGWGVRAGSVVVGLVNFSTNLRQLLFEMAEAVFGALAWCAAHNHASNNVLLLCDLSLEFFKSAIKILRHDLTTMEVRICSQKIGKRMVEVPAEELRIPSLLRSSPTDHW
jgi:hypothetical protein